MPYAEVAVNAPLFTRGTFSYSIPPAIEVAVGQAVWVPFGPRLVQGIVVEVSSVPQVEETRDIVSLVEPRLGLKPVQLELARWLSRRYLCPLFEAIRPLLPPGFERQALEYVEVADPRGRTPPSELAPALDIIRQRKVWRLDAARLHLGPEAPALEKLLRMGFLVRRTEPRAAAVRPRTIAHFELAVTPAEAKTVLGRLGARSRSMAQVLDYLIEHPAPLAADDLRKRFGRIPPSLKSLQERGVVRRVEVPYVRDPLAGRHYPSQNALSLTGAQRASLDSISAALNKRPQDTPNAPSVFLLHGVTGSGKTEVYLQALAHAIARGKRGIVLVPEISLTPQTIQRFSGRFPGRVGVWHSQLSLGQQFDEWQRIEKGEFDVVIGSRSAVFAPQPELGLIVLDEEHEPSYKQDEGPLRYHARDVAIHRASLEGAVVVLGSATPDVSSFYLARQDAGAYRVSLLSLPERVSASGSRPLATVKIVDMTAELKAGNRSIFSRELTLSLSQALSRGQQAILFMNRRGTSTFVQCRDCGLALRCRSCDLALTYHEAEQRLVCHQCNSRRRVPDTCPRCHSPRIKFLGIGTQRLETETGIAFPGARILRWDRDVIRGGQEHEKILDRFLRRDADILIGTQMVAKGLDMPGVTLVGVVMADTGLHLPDFRAAERTFQLISQVAGRAGRGSEEGHVVVQTYSPEHYAIIAGAAQDYRAFYEREISYRREYRNPPFTQLVRLVFAHTNATRCQSEAEKLAERLRRDKEARGFGDIDIVGPGLAFEERVRGRYRWQLVLRGRDPKRLLEGETVPPGNGLPVPHAGSLPKGWSIDIDPMNFR